MPWQPEKVRVVSPLESNGAIPINIQDQHTEALDLFFIKSTGVATTLAAVGAPGDYQLTLTSAVGFVAGAYVGVFSPTGVFFFAQQLGAPAGNIITLDTPVDKSLPIGATVLANTRNMNVDGSVTPQIFQIGPIGASANISLDITRVMGYLQDNLAMDDATFGGIPALTRGVVLRQNNGLMKNFWNVKTNGDLGLICFDFTYSSRAPAGSFGARFRSTYAGPEKHGVTIRLTPGDTLEMIIQDNLTALEIFTMMAQGHYVTD